MNNCTKYYDEIIFFDDLEAAEQQLIQDHLEECVSCRDHFNKITEIITSLKNDIDRKHVNGELLIRFVINENFPKEADFDGKRLSAYEATMVRGHLQVCNTCRMQYERMVNDFDSLEAYLIESRIPDIKLRKNRIATVGESISSLIDTIARRWQEFQTHPKRKYAFIPAVGLTLLLLVFLFIPLSRGNGNIYIRLGQLEKTEISHVTRGTGMSLLQLGIAEFNKGNYASSVRMLEQFISEESNDPNLAFADYVCGLAYLFDANKNLDNLKPIHHQYIDKGIEHLLAVISSSSNLRFREGANWYMGKAYLMKEDGPTAVKYFERVRHLNGRKSKQARKIVAELEKNLISTK